MTMRTVRGRLFNVSYFVDALNDKLCMECGKRLARPPNVVAYSLGPHSSKSATV